MKVVKFIIKFTGYFVYKVFPMPSASSRDQNKWVFASHTGWNHSNNAKSLFLQLQEAISHKDSDITAIWIAQNRREACTVRTARFRSYVWYSLKGLYHCLTAGVYIYTDTASNINRLTSRTAFCVDLWHGAGIKKMLASDTRFYCHYYGFKKEPYEHSFLDRMKVPLYIYRKPDIMLCTSRFQGPLLARMFQIPEEQIILAGYPRNDMLLWPHVAIRKYAERYASQEDLAILDELAARRFDKVYIYMPTWRIGCKESVLSMAGIDFSVLEDALVKNNSLFIVKLHISKQKWQFRNTPHIVVLPDICEIYTVLPYTDCLITDYSSIYSDYLLMNKEIILFPFDREVYASDSHQTFDYDTYYLGKKVYTFDALVNLIRENEDCHLSSEEHKRAMRIYQECHGNGVDLIREIRRRHEEFLNAHRKGKIRR